ncbi:hypothetical protein BO86DRAFT_451003 [Aspergillus japonicus CBS 114.51]|uniref:Xylanolytic transcriptional activator regulatory domain-containing protein n=1 Tax=Aspergillus japonicus CBS 114.51 TaxID=1448312 RepID=A0A8T8WPB1_ASPJA|nr:hypothetical protein BO86DRAFT_451003 [Aspergillus japonicus CBS 114.51]RAH77480.1 hypothetical protein BO86DRAFT_451003 [Aspergillus japonicus CBS 114.51]
MGLVWLADIPQGRRRSRALRACAHCQRKKKRCRHLATEDVARFLRQSLLDTNSSTTVTTARTTSTTPIIHKSSRTERFVGDLNPEAAIREKLDFANGIQLRDRIGLWVSSPIVQTREEHISHSESTRAHDAPSHHGLGSQLVASLLHQQSEFAFKTCERLPSSTRNHLLSIYFTKLNHILPLVDPDSLLSPHAGDLISVFLERAVCLVAAKDRAAEPYLRLCEEGQVMTSHQFCSEIYGELVVAMNVGLEADRITRIRILALMSLHYEGYEGAELASMHLCQAVHQAQTVGLHLHRPGRRSEDSLSSLFWCLWTLDRMHACLGGRPVLMSERDIGIAKPRVDHFATKSAFDISSDHTVGWEADFPTFESITGDRCSDLDFATLGFLELYYHAVCILACRYRLSHPADFSKPSYVRQGLAAVRIHSIVATECSGGLPPLPIIPYALTLSMGVSYQQFRSSKLITHLDRARAGLEACCVLLERISAYWSTAEAMARLGRKALHQIDVGNPKYQLHDHENEQPLDHPSVCTPRFSEETMPVLLPSSSNAGQGIHTDILLPMYTQAQPTPNALGVQNTSSSDHECGRFADIDFLFGEFLDLSLPTNFLDPVFLSPEQPEA